MFGLTMPMPSSFFVGQKKCPDERDRLVYEELLPFALSLQMPEPQSLITGAKRIFPRNECDRGRFFPISSPFCSIQFVPKKRFKAHFRGTAIIHVSKCPENWMLLCQQRPTFLSILVHFFVSIQKIRGNMFHILYLVHVSRIEDGNGAENATLPWSSYSWMWVCSKPQLEQRVTQRKEINAVHKK